MILFKPKQCTPQLKEKVKNEKEICEIHQIYRKCYEHMINYYSRVVNCIDLQIVKPLISECKIYLISWSLFSVKPSKLAKFLFQQLSYLGFPAFRL